MSSNSKSSDAKEEATPALVPKLRFPEFKNAGEWVEDTLDDIATFRRGSFPQPYGLPEWYDEKNGMPFIQVFDVGDDFRLKEKTKSKISKLGAEKSVFIPEGTLIVTLQGSIGRVAITHYNAYIDRTLLIFESFQKPIDKVFFSRVIQNLFDIEKEKAPGGIIKTITKESLSDFKVKYPPFEEQLRIAECLSSVDELISAQARKVDALKTHKKGLMQGLFPREGETQPRLRFPEFKGEWNDVTLGELCFNVSSGKDARDFDGVFDLYGSTGVIGKTATASYDTPHILVARVGANAGYLTKASGQFGVTDNTLVIKLKPAATIDYIFHYLGNININKLIFGSGQPLITGSILKAQRVLVPAASEQRKISSCLSSIDDLFNAESDKLDALKAHKKGLMQQLFPSAEEVEV